ncbi:chaplin [Streptomyces sp. NBC_01176]|uniref:chaplin n=1 Tax=Streptomyces sp. NBC_01176 TaxID=2903760 RepID=UPI00386E2C2B|nr:chaplin [Streptomyces sp. NBC_01176]
MKRVTRNGLIAAAAASGALAVTMPAYADSAAQGGTAGSPGLISGDTIQLPVHVPVNACGNTVNVAGLLNPAAGNTCANVSDGGAVRGVGGGSRAGGRGPGAGGTHSGNVGAHTGRASGTAGGGALAQGGGKDSPGLLSGNGLQLPVDLPVNVSGNSVNVVGLGNASVGNTSTNTSGGVPAAPVPAPKPPTRAIVPEKAPDHAAEQPMASLAHTGADQTVPAIAASAALLLGGAVLYRRFRPAALR